MSVMPLAVWAFVSAVAPSWAARTVEVRLDGATELEAVVWRLSVGSATLADAQSAYVKEALRRFSDLSHHPAPAFYRERLAPRPDELDQAVARLSPPPELAERLPFIGAWKHLFGGAEGAEEWVARLRDFAREARFTQFLREAGPTLKPELSRLGERVRRLRPAQSFEEYAGLPFRGRLTVVAAPLRRPGMGGGVVTRRADGDCDVSVFVGPRLHEPRLEFDDPRLATALWHEMAHCALDPLADLLAPDEARPGNQQDLREHVAEAVALRLTARVAGTAAYAIALADQSATDPVLLSAMVDRLAQYETRRDLYPTLAHFYTRLRALTPAAAPKTTGGGWLEAQAAAFPARGQRRLALELLSLVPEKEGGADALALRAALLLRDGRLEEAEAAARRLSPGGEDQRARLVLGVAALLGGRRQEGRALLDSALDGCRRDICQDVEAWISAARGLRPTAVAPPPPAKAQVVEPNATLLEKAAARYAAGDLRGAETALEAARDAGWSWDARVSLGVVWEATGRAGRAEEEYGRLIREAEAGDSPYARERLGVALCWRGALRERAGRYAEAEADLARALSAAPQVWNLRPHVEDTLARLRLRKTAADP